jgi:hypothetical protein
MIACGLAGSLYLAVASSSPFGPPGTLPPNRDVNAFCVYGFAGVVVADALEFRKRRRLTRHGGQALPWLQVSAGETPATTALRLTQPPLQRERIIHAS